MTSAAGPADLPRDPAPQIALVGRSNVGKSSLINALTRRSIARTSAAPGKTRLINLYRVELDGFTPERLYLVDMPGYGYARGGETSARWFDHLTRSYFACPSQARAGRAGYGPSAALLVVDARHPGLHADVMAHVWLNSTTLPWAAVASKIDKLTKAERSRAVRAWESTLNAEVVPVAATTGDGLDAVWKTIGRLLTSTSPPRDRGRAEAPPPAPPRRRTAGRAGP